jgi:hypothetical protein
MRWWQCGLLGGIVLSLATAFKVVRAIVLGAAGKAEWGEAVGFALFIFGMGFVCGAIAWAGRGLYRRFGMAGDALVGLVIMVCFFAACMLLAKPELLTQQFLSGGVLMLGFAAVVGLIAGAWTGHGLRKEWAKQERTRRAGDDDDDRPHSGPRGRTRRSSRPGPPGRPPGVHGPSGGPGG